MSDKETKKEEKFMTSYDRKVQRRKAEKEREAKEAKMSMIISIVVVIALAALVASFPIRRYMDIHGTYVSIGGVDITKPEFDYYYNLSVNSYLTQNSSYLSYFGLDTSKDFASQAYSETMSWKDYFEELTVNNLKQNKALKMQADADGFTYDASEDMKKFENDIKEKASEAGTTIKEYIRSLYGGYATMDRIKTYFEEARRGGEYYSKISDERAATEQEIQQYYEENKNDYDSIDFYQNIVKAELPTEPTELADISDETDDSDETEYTPSEEEIEAAMQDAKKLADKADAKDGELKENMKSNDVSYTIRDWLFDEARKQGDKTVIEDTTGNQYYVLAFEKRYLDNEPTVDARLIMTQTRDGQEILDEWKAGAATEDSFADLCTKYNQEIGINLEGGLLKGMTRATLGEEEAEWLFAPERKTGDTTSITIDVGYTYVLYYIGEGMPEWKNDISSILLNEAMTKYMDNLTDTMTVEDKKGNLKFIEIRAEEEAAQMEGSQAE